MRGAGFIYLLAGWMSTAALLSGCYPKQGSLPYLIEASKADQPVRWDRRSPYMRIGAVPFPHDLVDMTAIAHEPMGAHAYRDGLVYHSRGDEVQTGILYTRRAGFIDIAHVRNAIDLTRYAYLSMRDGLEQPDRPILLKGSEPSVYIIELNAEAIGLLLADHELEASTRCELAIVSAQRVSHVMSTWHEIITYVGFKGAGVLSERQSAFTWDDPPSNMLGVLIAGDILRSCLDAGDEQLETFNEQATDHLNRWLRSLQPMPPEASYRAAMHMTGVWHADHEPLRRMVHIGVDGEPVSPWFVPLEEFEQEPESVEPVVAWALPDQAGHAETVHTLMRIYIKPYIMESGALADLMDKPTSGLTIDVDTDFPVIQQRIVEQENQATLDG